MEPSEEEVTAAEATDMLRQLLRKLNQQLDVPNGGNMVSIDEVDVTVKFIVDLVRHMRANKIDLTEYILTEITSSSGQLSCIAALAIFILQSNHAQRELAEQEARGTKEIPDWLKQAMEESPGQPG